MSRDTTSDESDQESIDSNYTNHNLENSNEEDVNIISANDVMEIPSENGTQEESEDYSYEEDYKWHITNFLTPVLCIANSLVSETFIDAVRNFLSLEPSKFMDWTNINAYCQLERNAYDIGNLQEMPINEHDHVETGEIYTNDCSVKFQR